MRTKCLRATRVAVGHSDRMQVGHAPGRVASVARRGRDWGSAATVTGATHLGGVEADGVVLRGRDGAQHKLAGAAAADGPGLRADDGDGPDCEADLFHHLPSHGLRASGAGQTR